MIQIHRSLTVSGCLVLAAITAGCSTPNPTVDSGTDVPLVDVSDGTVSDVSETGPGDTGPTDTGPGDTGPSDSGPPANHLLISEVEVQPAATEFIEIYNPGDTAVDLTNYYVSDNSSYYTIAQGMPWNPPTNNPGTDFLVRFPSGASIASHAAIVIATDPMYVPTLGRCPDYILSATALTCTDAGMGRPMIAPTNGDLGTSPGQMLSNAREMVVLFRWSGTVGERLQDVDYVTWGDTYEAGTRVDKTSITGYLPDTAVATQHGAPAPALNQSIERCGGEVGETQTGGNGITGHDETSERFDMSFRVQTAPNPGTPSACP